MSAASIFRATRFGPGVGAQSLGVPAAAYPGRVATNSDLIVAVDRQQTTLLLALGPTDTAMTVVDSSIGAYNLLSIDNEIVKTTGTGLGNTIPIQRGFDGTTAASHSAGATVAGLIDAYHHNVLVAEVEAIESTLGANLSKIFTGPHPFADLRGYGAVLDGVTNNWPALQAADAAGANIVIIPTNCIVVTNDLTGLGHVKWIIGEDINSSSLQSTSPTTIGIQVPSNMSIDHIAWKTVGVVDETGTPTGNFGYIEHYKNNRDVPDTPSVEIYNDYCVSSGKIGGKDNYSTILIRNYGVGDGIYSEQGANKTNSGTCLRARVSSTSGLGSGVMIERYGNAPGLQIQDFTTDAGGNAFGWPMAYVYTNYKTAGDILQIIHNTTNWASGNVLNIQLANASGSSTANFLNCSNGGSQKFYVDGTGNLFAAGEVQAASIQIKTSFIRSGVGSPVGSVPGNVGDLYLNTSGGAGTTLYVKESGAAGTTSGWVAK